MEESEEHPGVTKVKQMWERGEFEKIDRMVRFFDAVESLGIVGNMVHRFIIWSAIVAGAYIALNGHVTQ